MTQEDLNRDDLECWLAPAFETYREAPLRHALFRRRTLRVDLLAIPKDERFRDIALGFEVKGHDEWDKPGLAKALKQAGDYVLATVEPKDVPLEHAGKRVLAVFLWPAPRHGREHGPNSASYDETFMTGMMHMAGYHRVGLARVQELPRRQPLALSFGPNEVWVSDRGWRSEARNLLAGKRQIGSQRFPVLDELQAMEGRK